MPVIDMYALLISVIGNSVPHLHHISLIHAGSPLLTTIQRDDPCMHDVS